MLKTLSHIINFLLTSLGRSGLYSEIPVQKRIYFLYISNFSIIISVFCCTNGLLDFVPPKSVC